MDLLKPFLIQQQHKSSLVLVVVVCYFVRDYFSKSFLFCFCFLVDWGKFLLGKLLEVAVVVCASWTQKQTPWKQRKILYQLGLGTKSRFMLWTRLFLSPPITWEFGSRFIRFQNTHRLICRGRFLFCLFRYCDL